MMDVHVRVDLDEGGPVVVKSATGAGAERLRRERARLERAVHPGVVALAGDGGAPDDGASVEAASVEAASHDGAPGDGAPGDGASDDGAPGDGAPEVGETELRTRYAGEPVVRWSGSVSHVAGLGAAVASTLADLHDMGIAHGRLDATHILLGDDGRPRLCGFSHPGDANPSDDIAALGDVLGQLVERARPEPARRFPRLRHAGGSDRRLRPVIEHATDPVASRRPSARALADAILRAVPTAALPIGGGRGADDAGRPRDAERGALGPVDPDGPVGAAREPDTLDRIWAFPGAPSDDERWAAALGTGPPDLVPQDRDDPPLPLAPVDTPAWPERHDDRIFLPLDSEDDDVRDGGPGGVDTYDDDSRHHDPSPASHGDGAHLTPDDADDSPAHAGDPYGRDAIDLRDAPRGSRGDALARDGDVTRDHRAASGRVAPGARPEAEPAGAPVRHRRAVVLGAAALVVIAVAVGGAVIVGTGGGADTPRPDDAAATPAPDCPPVAPPAADVDGDGCPEHLVVEGTTIDAGVAGWSLGEPGDVVALGSWHCDGDASAALLRPATGEVFFFSGWAGHGEPLTVGASRQVVGAVGIRADPDGDGCDRLVVDLDTGGTAPVEVPR